MLKKNQEEEQMILLNSNYEIEGITESLVKRWKITQIGYKNICGLNLFLIFPGLIEMAKISNGKKGKSMKSLRQNTYVEEEINVSNYDSEADHK